MTGFGGTDEKFAWKMEWIKPPSSSLDSSDGPADLTANALCAPVATDRKEIGDHEEASPHQKQRWTLA
jgi:hypothetical protein